MLTALNAASIVSLLLITTIGLAVIFGILGIVNLAHGEFIALGGYATVVAAGLGIHPGWSILIAFVGVGLLALIIEPILIQHLYGKTMESILATWGLGLIIRQLIEAVWGKGHHQALPSIDFSFQAGNVRYSGYRVALMLFAAVVIAFFLWLRRNTTLGLQASAVMSNSSLAAAVGVDVRRVYRTTFALGAALTGLAGAVVAPLVGVSPAMGLSFVSDSFLAILVGGVGSLFGLVGASAVLGATDSVVSLLLDPVMGSIVFIVLAVLLMSLRDSSLWLRVRFRG